MTERLFALLDGLGIATDTHHHPPAFTVEQGNRVWGAIPGIHCKNLFLKDAKGKLWLVVAPGDRSIDLKRLPERIGSARLSFGSGELLQRVLGVEPGSVTPFALINDEERRVSLVLDAWMMAQPLLNFHPLRNDMTTTIASGDFRRFLAAIGHVGDEVTL
jgi:Ala-tRNA(Pro) deacylase